MLIWPDYYGWFRIQFSYRRVMGGEETGRFSQADQYRRCDGEMGYGFFRRFNPHQGKSDFGRDFVFWFE